MSSGALSPGTRLRMRPDQRREQLLQIGVEMLATRPLEEITIELLAEEAGISRGLLYHYFAGKHEFHLAIVRRAVEDLYAITAPRGLDDPLAQLTASMGAYLDYVRDNHTGYTSLIRAAKGGNDELREIYETARQALTDRVFDAVGPEALAGLGIVDSPLTRMIARAWACFCEDLVLTWVADPDQATREELLTAMVDALPATLGSGARRR